MAKSELIYQDESPGINDSSSPHLESHSEHARNTDIVQSPSCIIKDTEKVEPEVKNSSETESSKDLPSLNQSSFHLKPSTDPKTTENRIDLESRLQLLFRFLSFLGFKNQKTQKTIKDSKPAYNLLIAINSSSSSECETFELFPILLTLTEDLIEIEFFICENKRPLEVSSEVRSKIEEMMNLVNPKIPHFRYEIKPSKNCVVFKATPNPKQKFEQLFFSELLEIFCLGLRIFSDTVETFYKILKNNDSNLRERLENYKIPENIDRVFISDPETVDCIYPFNYKPMVFSSQQFNAEKNLLFKLLKERKELFWYVIDEENQTIHYPHFNGMKTLAEVTGINKVDGLIQSFSQPTSVNKVLLCLEFFNDLLKQSLYLVDFFSLFFVLEERGKNVLVVSGPVSNHVNQDDGDEIMQFVGMGFVNILGKFKFAPAHILDISDQLENLNFETRTARVLGDDVRIVQMIPEFQIGDNDILYGYIWREGKFYLVMREFRG